eukprot:Amastigsp_a174760_125.p2 type:complete len:191 gc:universal Amastigsp_a174760_125:854-1426(+)
MGVRHCRPRDGGGVLVLCDLDRVAHARVPLAPRGHVGRCAHCLCERVLVDGRLWGVAHGDGASRAQRAAHAADLHDFDSKANARASASGGRHLPGRVLGDWGRQLGRSVCVSSDAASALWLPDCCACRDVLRHGRCDCALYHHRFLVEVERLPCLGSAHQRPVHRVPAAAHRQNDCDNVRVRGRGVNVPL